MANNDHKLNLEENSKYRVAFDLMEKVAKAEGKYPEGDEARKYYFDLFHQSYRVVYYGEKFDEAEGTVKGKSSNKPVRSIVW